MKKFIYFIIVSTIMFLSANVSASTYSKSISITSNPATVEYINGLSINVYKNGSYNIYLLNNTNTNLLNTSYSNAVVANNGVNEIISNSSSIYEANKNYYITQTAILWYMDYLYGTSNLSSYIKTYITTHLNDGMCNEINRLYNLAKSNNYLKMENKNITFYKNGSYYYSNDISVSTSNLKSTPSVKYSNAPTSTTTVNNTMVKTGTGSFKIKIPKNNYEKYSGTFTITVSGTVYTNNYYEYNNGSVKIVYSRGYNSTSDTVSDSAVVTLDNYYDDSNYSYDYDDDDCKFYINNDYNDPNIYIKIYDNSDNLVKSYKSTKTKYSITLSDGYYYVIVDGNKTKFKIKNGELYVYDNGYILSNNINLISDNNVEDNNYIIDDNNINNEDIIIDSNDNVVDENNYEIERVITTDVEVITNTVDCPITDLSCTIKYIIGSIVLLLGSFLVYLNVKKSKKNN